MTEPVASTAISGGTQTGIIGAASVTATQIIINNYPASVAEPASDAGEIGPCPYPGLAYFGPNDADRFFGRDEAIGKLATAVGRQSLTALVGASGSGKSSVVLAGLAPRLHRGRGWLFSYFRIGNEPDRDPFLALARALVPFYLTGTDETERLVNINKLAEKLRSGELTLRNVFAACRSQNKGSRILLIADQFEEAFTLVRGDADRSHFIDLLLAGFPDPAPVSVPDICLVLTLRGDFYGHALRHRALADALQNHVENLGPMNREELRAAIVRPAENAGVAFETLLDTVQSKPGGLPLLQFALREMWGRQERKKITRKSYDESGGVEGALAKRAQAIYEDLTEQGEDTRAVMLFRRLFTRLVTLGEGAEDTRRIVGRQELGPEAWQLAQRLAGEDNRLVVTSAPAPGHEAAEVVHEALIRNWPALIEWVNRDRAFQSWLRQLKPRLDEWRDHPLDQGALLRGSPLAVAEEWLGRRRDEISETECTYIEASITLREVEKRREEDAIAREQARLTEIAAGQQRTARLQRYLFTALACVVAALVGWSNESYLRERWYWFTVMRPYMVTHVRPYVLTAERERALRYLEPFKECAKDCPEMIVIPAGEVTMGSPDGENDISNNSPPHKVIFAKPFAVSKFELTFDDWDACAAHGDCESRISDSDFGRGRQPVINVNWDDAKTYVKWLSTMTGKSYRLLSEAEYEYAARARTSAAYPWGDDVKMNGMAMANCNDCGSEWDGKRPAPVGSFAPNQFNLHDMVGNVWVWVEDCLHSNYDEAPVNGSAWLKDSHCESHILRGGSWEHDPRSLRLATRSGNTSVLRVNFIGVRVGRTLGP
jgi:formylglycine-generating enzyme required for sulfatase activity